MVSREKAEQTRFRFGARFDKKGRGQTARTGASPNISDRASFQLLAEEHLSEPGAWRPPAVEHPSSARFWGRSGHSAGPRGRLITAIKVFYGLTRCSQRFVGMISRANKSS